MTKSEIEKMQKTEAELARLAAPDELAPAFAAKPLRAVDDELTAQEHLLDPSGDAPPLEERVVDAAVVLGRSDGPGLIGVEQDDVAVGANGDGALLREHAKQFRRRRRRQFDEPVQRHALVVDAAVEHQRQPRFQTRRAVIQKRSEPILKMVAWVLRAYPFIRKVRIEGHTDDRGDAARNLKLSQARAEAVRAFLVKQGVDAARLEARGYGQTRPVQAGCAKLRRWKHSDEQRESCDCRG